MTAGHEITPGDAASTERLMHYWLHDAGIPWGVPGAHDFDVCVAKVTKVFTEHHIDIDPRGFCSNLHEKATGARPGHAPGEHHG